MDRGLRDNKLESLRRCLQRITEKRPDAVEDLAEDVDLQDIITVNLQRAVQICVDLASALIADRELRPPTTMAEAFTLLQQHRLISDTTAEQMKKAVGFRNVVVHDYQAIDWQIVFKIIHHQLVDFENFAKETIRATDE
jgi:uncharacterized protein YutE (UPF0331/DUF86 family)